MVHRRLLAEIAGSGGRALYERGKFSRAEHDSLILMFIREHGDLTIAQAARLAHGVMLVSEVRKALKRLVAEGSVTVSGTEYHQVFSILNPQ